MYMFEANQLLSFANVLKTRLSIHCMHDTATANATSNSSGINPPSGGGGGGGGGAGASMQLPDGTRSEDVGGIGKKRRKSGDKKKKKKNKGVGRRSLTQMPPELEGGQNSKRSKDGEGGSD
jgi:hypothetical protein